MYITRDEAVETLYDVINSGIIDKELGSRLEDVANCISHEKDNLFLWGAEDDAANLFIMVREDLITPEWEEHMSSLYEKYRIREVT